MLTIKQRMKNHYKQFIADEDLVFDIGAYKGELSEIFLSLGAKIVCVEPQTKYAQMLIEKFDATKKVKVINKGVSDIKERLPLYVCTNSGSNSTFSIDWQKHPRQKQRKWEKYKNIDMITLQDLIDIFGKPKFCKIDVEGFEEKAIRGLKSKIPYLSFEFDQEFYKQMMFCVRYLNSLGKCTFNYSKYYNYLLASPKWLTSEELISEIKSQINGYLRGDIYVRYDI